MGYTKLSTRASKAADAAKSKKVQAMKAKRKASKAVGKAMGLQRSGSSLGSKKAAYNTKSKTWRMK